MKKYVCFWLVLFTICLAASPSFAKDAEGLSVTPSQLTVTGMRGATEARTLLLRTEKTLTNLKPLPLDLPRSDGNVVLPMSAIQVTLAKNSLDPKEPLSVTIKFSLKNVPSGEFKGELLIGHDEGTLTLPVTVKVKDPPWGALLMLLVGIGLSLGVSNYRARGKPRDEVLVRVGQVRAQMRSDRELHEQFRSRIKGSLIDVEDAFQAEKWPKAQEAVEKAEAYWVKWRKWRSDWLAQFSYQSALHARLEGVPPQQALAIRTLICESEGALRNAPDLETPDAFRQQLQVLAQQLDRFLTLTEHVERLNGRRQKLHYGDEGQKEAWRLKILGFQRALANLKPDDEKGYASLQAEIDKASADVEREIAQQATREAFSASKGVRDFDDSAGREILPTAPLTQKSGGESPADNARKRLAWFNRISYAVAVIFLAGAGFGELYVANATFGANAWSDYLALLAWGFGAEATRASVTDMIKGWGVKTGKA